MASVQNFLIPMLLVVLFASVFGSFFATGSNYYSTTDYDNSTMSELEGNLDNISDRVDTLKSEARKIQQPTNIVDILGGFFNSAYQTMLISFQSLGLFTSMANTVAEDSGIPSIGLFITIGVLIVTIIFVFGILIKSIIKN